MRKLFYWAAFGLGLLVLVQVIGAVTPRQSSAAATSVGTRDVWLLRGPIHTDFVLPVTQELKAAFAGANLEEDTGWILAGWGSRGFYTTTGSYLDLSLPVVWSAALGDDSVVRLVKVPQTVAEPRRWAHQRIALSDAQYRHLLDAIAADIQGPVMAGVSLSAGDAFYPAAGRFHLLRTCNSWVAAKLTQIGLSVGAFTPTTGGLRFSLWWFGHADF